jgi:hypothetical protein
MKTFTLSLLLMAVLATKTSAETGNGKVVSIAEFPDRLRIELNGELFTEYLHEGDDRFFPVFYPVLGPGQVGMTRRYPIEIVEGEDTDHPHHQSLWFAHTDINGETFWAIQAYRGREPGRTVHQGYKEIVSGDDGGHFIAENAYIADDGRTILTDTRTVRILPIDKADDPRVLDITIAFHASHGEVVFGDEKDAGMAIRVAPELQVVRRTAQRNVLAEGAGNLLNSEGDRDGETWGKRARWVDVWGKINGMPVGVALMDHPDNPRHPTWWHSRTYGLLTANAFGQHFFEDLEDRNAGALVVPEGETATFRWRFVFHQGGPEDAEIESHFEAFASD